MATAAIAKPHTSKWFSNKALQLNLPSLRPKHIKSSSFSSSTLPSPPSSLLTKKNSKKEEDFQIVFHYFDSDGDGKLSGHELRAYFKSVGEALSDDEAQTVISEFDSDSDDMLEFEDFVQLMEGHKKNGDVNDDEDDDLRRAFEMFEVDKGCGCITPKGLQLVLNRLGSTKSYEECDAMIRVFDLDGNGVLDYYEFKKMMTT